MVSATGPDRRRPRSDLAGLTRERDGLAHERDGLAHERDGLAHEKDGFFLMAPHRARA